MKLILILGTFLFTFTPASQAQETEILSPEIQVRTAVLAAPEDQRDQAMVYGYTEDGQVTVLREGSNNLVCLADDPEKEGIQVACYSKKLDPFIARGRELREEGKTTQELREARRQEVEAGSLKMPDAPSMQYILTGDEEHYDPETGDLQESFMRYVIYTPFATTESTGLPDKPYAPVCHG